MGRFVAWIFRLLWELVGLLAGRQSKPSRPIPRKSAKRAADLDHHEGAVPPAATVPAELNGSPDTTAVRLEGEEGHPQPPMSFGEPHEAPAEEPTATSAPVQAEEVSPSPAAPTEAPTTDLGSGAREATSPPPTGGARGRPQRGRSTLPPEKWGAHPRGPATPRAGAAEEPAGTKPPQVEIVCWEQGRLWYVGVQLPEMIDPGSIEVTHNGLALTPEQGNSGRYELGELLGLITVRSKNGASDPVHELSLDQPFLIFKLAGEDGRRVDCPRRGLYGIAAPGDWTWDSEHNGPPVLEPERCSIRELRMHFFDTGVLQARAIAFLRPSGTRRVIRVGKQMFRLTGRSVDDVSRHGGPLFTDAPILEADFAADWASAGTIVVGEEGPRKGGWRFHFQPTSDETKQALPQALADREGGWYFVRIYSREGNPIESLDFRFLAGLDAIDIEPRGPLPGSDGHEPACVRIVHDSGCRVDVDERLKLEAHSREGVTEIIVPARADADRLRGELRRNAVSVHFEVAVPRVWWSLSREGRAPDRWFDRPVEVHRESLRPTSDDALWLRLPPGIPLKAAQVGFGPGTVKSFRRAADGRHVIVPLREFGDCEQAVESCQRYELLLALGAEPDHQIAVCELIPRILCLVDECRFETDSETAIQEHLARLHAEFLVKSVTVYVAPRETSLDTSDVISKVLAHSCTRCARYTVSPPCPLYATCKAGRPLGEAVHFQPKNAVRREVFECRWGCALQGRVRALEHLLSKHREELYACK